MKKAADCISGLGTSRGVWAECTHCNRGDSEVHNCEPPPHGEYKSLTALILATYTFFSSSSGEHVANIKCKSGVASLELEHFNSYDKITHFVLYYRKAHDYTICNS